MKMQNTIVIRRDYLHYVRKYSRFEKRHKNMSVHLSPCFRLVFFIELLSSEVFLSKWWKNHDGLHKHSWWEPHFSKPNILISLSNNMKKVIRFRASINARFLFLTGMWSLETLSQLENADHSQRQSISTFLRWQRVRAQRRVSRNSNSCIKTF